MMYKNLWRKLHSNLILRAWAVNMNRLCPVSLRLMRPAFCDRLGHDLGGLLGNIILAAANRYGSTH